ncbi:hypothetical protein AAVH_06802 [Aphelenchoides avenae]|nr:hypothetical protein AAVH_06802 [Aphelenchus avenae]
MAGIKAMNAWLRQAKVMGKRSKPPNQPPAGQPEEDDPDIRYPVQAFLDERFEAGRRFLLAEWVGYDEASWEPIENIYECDALLKSFNKQADPGFDELDESVEERGLEDVDEGFDDDQ